MIETVTILVDTSGSMARLEGLRRRIDILRDVLVLALAYAPQARIIAFDSVPHELTGLEPHAANLKLPEPGGARHSTSRCTSPVGRSRRGSS
jgi:hypothetical protein